MHPKRTVKKCPSCLNPYYTDICPVCNEDIEKSKHYDFVIYGSKRDLQYIRKETNIYAMSAIFNLDRDIFLPDYTKADYFILVFNAPFHHIFFNQLPENIMWEIHNNNEDNENKAKQK